LQTVRAVPADRRKSSAREAASGRENRRKDWPLGPETETHERIKADTGAWVKGSRTRPVATQPRIAREKDHGAEPSLE
jgi:hypothetical protein